MTYTPLKESYLWYKTQDSLENCASINPTGWESLMERFFSYGNGCSWINGMLISCYAEEERPFFKTHLDLSNQDEPYIGTCGALSEDYTKHQILNDVMTIPREKMFLWKGGRLSMLSDNSSKALSVPKDVEIHSLSAMMILFKYAAENPDQLEDKYGYTQEKQMLVVNKVLGLCIKIVEERNLHDELKQSMAEFERELDFLSEKCPGYIRKEYESTVQSEMMISVYLDEITFEEYKKLSEDARSGAMTYEDCEKLLISKRVGDKTPEQRKEEFHQHLGKASDVMERTEEKDPNAHLKSKGLRGEKSSGEPSLG